MSLSVMILGFAIATVVLLVCQLVVLVVLVVFLASISRQMARIAARRW